MHNIRALVRACSQDEFFLKINKLKRKQSDFNETLARNRINCRSNDCRFLVDQKK